MDLYSLMVLQLWGLLLFLGSGEGLNCWHCIAENCDKNPEDNYKAYKTQCQPGQQCQKVFFKMKSDVKTMEYTSTVRSCAEQCQNQDDFPNCTEWQFITRGCVRRSCCNDDDLCNAAQRRHLSFFIVSASGPARVTLLAVAAILFWRLATSCLVS